jgi:hypothetical protein
MDSGSVYVRGVVGAAAIGRLWDGTLVVDPDEEDEKVLGGGGCFAFMFVDEEEKLINPTRIVYGRVGNPWWEGMMKMNCLARGRWLEFRH